MENIIKIEFDVIPTAPDFPLSLAVYLDDREVWQKSEITETCHVVLEVDDSAEANHSLQWKISGKLPHYTVIDDQGNITRDSMLRIDKLIMDDVDSTQFLQSSATYTHDFNGTGTLQTSIMYQDLGCNGVAELKFTTPVYLWLLENM